MAKIAVRVNRAFSVGAGSAAVFELLADVPRSVGHFPKVRQLVDLGENTYRWEMEPMGTAGISHQVVYACRYQADTSGRQVAWTPLPDVGNGEITGHWRIDAGADATTIAFQTQGHLDVPVPRLLRSVAEPFVLGEFARSVDTYIDNLCRSLGGRR